MKVYNKQSYDNNKDSIKIQRKTHYQENKSDIKTKRKGYYQKKKLNINAHFEEDKPKGEVFHQKNVEKLGKRKPMDKIKDFRYENQSMQF